MILVSEKSIGYCGAEILSNFMGSGRETERTGKWGYANMVIG